MKEIVFTKDAAESAISKIKGNWSLTYSGGVTLEAAIYNTEGTCSIDYSRKRKTYGLTLEKETQCYACGRAEMFFETETIDEVITIINCYDS